MGILMLQFTKRRAQTSLDSDTGFLGDGDFEGDEEEGEDQSECRSTVHVPPLSAVINHYSRMMLLNGILRTR
jgi:hypothetical protein